MGSVVKRALLRIPGVETFRRRQLRRPESTWTPPRPDCPDPKWWHASDPASAEIEVTELVAAFVRALQPELVVETGTAYGQTARAIGRALRRNGHGRLVSLEVDLRLVERARNRTRHLPVEVRCQSSLEYTPDQPIDFAWFDSLPHMRADEFRRYLPHMHAGTIVGFHDSGPQHVVRAHLDELVDEGLMWRLELATPRGVTFAQPIGVDTKPRPHFHMEPGSGVDVDSPRVNPECPPDLPAAPRAATRKVDRTAQ
jgi:hypothetical protein